MSVTLFDTGLTITDPQAARLDAYAVAIWLPRYINEHGSEPAGWPSPTAHEVLAEYAIFEMVKETVLRWELKVARSSIALDPWEG